MTMKTAEQLAREAGMTLMHDMIGILDGDCDEDGTPSMQSTIDALERLIALVRAEALEDAAHIFAIVEEATGNHPILPADAQAAILKLKDHP